jgi:hypothetical protein
MPYQQPPQPSYAPYQQPMQRLSVRCAQGRLIITDTFIIVERGNLRSASLPRTALSGVDVRMSIWIPLPGMSRYRLTFHGQGNERIHASNVSKRAARQVKALLTGR